MARGGAANALNSLPLSGHSGHGRTCCWLDPGPPRADQKLITKAASERWLITLNLANNYGSDTAVCKNIVCGFAQSIALPRCSWPDYAKVADKDVSSCYNLYVYLPYWLMRAVPEVR